MEDCEGYSGDRVVIQAAKSGGVLTHSENVDWLNERSDCACRPFYLF